MIRPTWVTHYCPAVDAVAAISYIVWPTAVHYTETAWL